ncbi:hypothetical protein GCM10027347_38430 [Larkinella harenae]
MVFFVHAQTIYKEFEVDSVAHPIGGLPLLEKFVDVNRRMPYAAEVNRTKGAVILSAVVEPNGKISEVNLLRKLQPDCDREAVRVLRLFNAWIPAQKDGKTVRQQITYTVRFVPNGLDCRPGQIIRYYNDKGEFTDDSTKAAFRLVSPVDTLGYPTEGPIVYRKNGKSWKEFSHYRFQKESFMHYNHDDPALPDSISAYRLQIFDELGSNQQVHYSFLADGTLLSSEPYEDGKRSRTSYYYYRNGVVKSLEESDTEKKTREWRWYPTGQLHQVGVRDMNGVALFRYELQQVSQWDSTGKPTVVNGTGQATFTSLNNRKLLRESGMLENSQKNGDWVGRLKNDQLVYRETYDNGKLISGKLYDEKGNVSTYNELEKQPEFKGGMAGLGRFLSSTLRYPVEAQQKKVQGRVLVTFTIDADGHVSDVKVIRGIGYGADEEAMRVVKATDGKWTPGIQRGRKVNVRYTMPLNFALQ